MAINIPNTNEDYIQQNAITLLESMGYTFIRRELNVKWREDKLNEVVFKNILSEQLKKINGFSYKGKKYRFSDKNIAKAIEALDVPLNEGLMNANQKISDMLLLGNSYEEDLHDGAKKSFSLKYIDWDNIENNVFHVTEEFSVEKQTKVEREKNRRPDLVLFVNGIPLAVVELKKSSIMTEEGISQMLRNQGKDEIPQLFKYIQLTLAGNSHEPKYATTGTSSNFYVEWKEEKPHRELKKLIKRRDISALDEIVYSLFSKNRLFEILQSYIIFDNKVKKIARHQQFFALQEIMKKMETFDKTGTRGGGLIWHTQGSGKSLTMSMLTKVIMKNIPGAKLIVVTDRKDLDRQIHTTFANSEIKAGRATSGRDLIEKLQSGMSVITTLIHKFETVEKEQITLDNPNIFVIVDESHRTQGGDLHRAMKKVFTHGCYLAFTGTPLLKQNKNSIAKFGGLIHKYTIDQAVRDKVVLPLLYEGRLVDQWIADQNGLDRKFALISANLNEKETADLKQKWARFTKVASSEQRLERIAKDIDKHFNHHVKKTGFKGMLATSSKYDAVKYDEIFKKFLHINTAFIISAPDTRDGFEEVDETNKNYVTAAWNKLIKDHGDPEQYLDKIKDEFVEGEEIDLLIVVDKLLTGFDAPRAQMLYIDKKLKDHTLLQAIARVNRLYDGKNFGIIIDYRGLLGNLDQALTSYSSFDGFDEQDIIGAVIDIKKEVAKVKTFYSHLQDLFAPVKNKNDNESYEVFLAAEEKRKEFYQLLSEYGMTLKLALSSEKIGELFTTEEISDYKKAMKFYNDLRNSVKIRYHEKVDFGLYEQQMQKLLDTFIYAKEKIDPITKLVNVFGESFEAEIQRVVGDNARADVILSATTKVINEKREQNPAYYDKLSKRIQDILDEYKEKRLTDEEKLKHAKDVRAMLMGKNNADKGGAPDEIKNNPARRAFYDNLHEAMQELPDAVFISTILEIEGIFQEVVKKPDWETNTDVKNNIDQQIHDILWNLEKTHTMKFADCNEIISRVRSIGISNYANK